MALSVTIAPRGGKPSKRFPLTLTLSQPAPTVLDLKSAIASRVKMNVHRQRITTKDKKVLDDDDKPLRDYGVGEGEQLEIKDLGPQIAWRTIFLVEYFGPLFIHPLFYLLRSTIYRSGDFAPSRLQTVALVLVLAHYAKRELETVFVHRFSSATMPWFNIIKNSAHYWGLSGVLLAAPLYGPWNSASALAGTVRDRDGWLYGWTALWAFAELSNLLTHLNLSSLRPAGTRVRQIPRGYGFDHALPFPLSVLGGGVSCANYWYETLAWTAFAGLTLSWAAALFLAVAVAQMYVWALKKHRRYRKEFGDKYPRGRR
ncbi:hypothetical protein JCM10207_006840, partial [Rhodosporidiobolus poonsookiae]